MISSISYNGDGSTRIFPVSFKINGEDYVRVYVDSVEVIDRTKYDIINNSIVFTSDDIPAIGTDNIQIYVATSSAELGDLGAPLTDITNVSNNLDAILAVSTTVVPNIDEILLADDNAVIATTKAGEALTSASNALVSEQNADTSEANALSYKNSAEASATTATTQAGIATTQAGIATTQAGIATTKAEGASTSANQALGYRNEAEGFANSINPAMLVKKDSSTGAAYIPVGTTAQRPVSPSNGYMRYNTDLLKFEGYQGGVWGTLGGLDINTLTTKATPIDADEMVLADSTSSFSLKKFTWANLKATLLTYFDTLYSRTATIFGVGQTWQDVKASREVYTTYTNSTGKPIEVIIGAMCTIVNGYGRFLIDGLVVYTGQNYSSQTLFLSPLSFVVPNGSTYRYDGVNGTPSIHSWLELR